MKCIDLAAEQFERAAQNHRRRDAVDVVIAVHGNTFALGDRAQQAIDGSVHVGEPHRIEQVIQRRLEKSRGRVDVGQPANGKQPRDHGRHAQLARQHLGTRVVTRIRLPNQRGPHGALRVSS